MTIPKKKLTDVEDLGPNEEKTGASQGLGVVTHYR